MFRNIMKFFFSSVFGEETDDLFIPLKYSQDWVDVQDFLQLRSVYQT
jgi:hypothetical protein